MDVEFDPAKDATNIGKHGISLARFIELEVMAVIDDDRFDEPRLRLYGRIDGIWHCAAVTVRKRAFRVISLRRAHAKEIRRHV